jgi:hypothetical protein
MLLDVKIAHSGPLSGDKAERRDREDVERACAWVDLGSELDGFRHPRTCSSVIVCLLIVVINSRLEHGLRSIVLLQLIAFACSWTKFLAKEQP